MLRVSVSNIKAPTVKVETVKMTGEGRCNKCMKLIAIYFSLSRCFTFGGLS